MIYVLGSLNMDLVAQVKRMPKAGETMYAERFYTGCGGKGANQAAAVAKLGGRVAMIGCVGDDAFGRTMKDNLASYGADVSYIRETSGSSGVALITVEKGDNRIIIDGGANLRLTNAQVDEALRTAKSGDILVAQLESAPEIVAYAFARAMEKGMVTVLNPAPARPLSEDLLRHVDVIAPNETETEILTGVNPKNEAHLALAVKHFYDMGIRHVIVTLGDKGAAVSVGREITYIEPRKVKAVDTTAAGDTFVGTVCVYLDRGKDILTACRYASVAASITITRPGAAASVPTAAEVEKVVAEEGIEL